MKFIFLFLLTIVSILNGGCSSKIEKHIWNNVAEIREYVMNGKNENISVSFTSGQREKDYKMNGYATELVEFGVITITIINIDEVNIDGANYILYVGTKKFSGELVQNPFDKTLVADIGEKVDKDKNMSVDIFINGEKFSLKLFGIDKDWNISSKDCVRILIEQYKEQLKSFIKDEFEGEIYIKIMNDYDMYSSDFYYYVSVIGRSGSYINMIISPIDGSILASNVNIVPVV